MARIVIDARRIRSTTGRYAHELIRELEALDDEHDYHIIVHDKDQGTWAPKKQNFFMHVVPWDHYTFGEQLGFARFLRRLKPDLVHFTMPQQPLLYFGKRVTTIHDLTLVRFKNIDKNKIIYNIEQLIFVFLLKNVTRRSVQVITPTKFVRDDLATFAKISHDKITVTYESAFPTQKLHPKAVDALKGEQFIINVGNAFPHKNQKRLIDAHQLYLEKNPHMQLVFVGKKEFFHRQIEKYAQSIEAKNVQHLGFVPDEQLVWLYNHAAAYLQPSLSEGFGLPGLEAMQHKTPLISSNATCLPEVYGEAAHYFDPEDPQAIADAIDEVVRSETRREEMARAAKKQLDKYSWAKMAKQTLRVYNKALEN